MARIKEIDKLRFIDMIFHFDQYGGLSEGLVELPRPQMIRIDRKNYRVPYLMDELAENICYGQRLFLTQEEQNDYDLITRIMDGYYYPIVTGKKWDNEKALLFGKKVLTCKAKELYPVAMHLINLISELVDREKKLLHREHSKLEKAAGIEKLNVFADMMSLDFLRDAMKITTEEVLLTPYKECLVRFMIQKETNGFQERYIELMHEQNKPKAKYHAK